MGKGFWPSVHRSWAIASIEDRPRSGTSSPPMDKHRGIVTDGSLILSRVSLWTLIPMSDAGETMRTNVELDDALVEEAFRAHSQQ